jgi:hypothetical protein
VIATEQKKAKICAAFMLVNSRYMMMPPITDAKVKRT